MTRTTSTLSWEIDAFTFDLPMMASAMDSAVSPDTAIEIGRLGGLAVLNLEGLWTRYEDPMPVYQEIANLEAGKATQRMQELYQEPVKPELITQRVAEVKAGGVLAAASLTPQHVERYFDQARAGGLDILVIQGTVVSAEHVSSRTEPLDLFKFIADCEMPVIVGGVASYAGALHLMRTGAVAVLVGVGPGAACTSRAVLGIGVPQATAIADAAGARTRYLEETGRYVHVIADGGMRTGGDVAKAIACGADAVMLGSPIAAAQEAPAQGYHWGMATFHPTLPRGARVETGKLGKSGGDSRRACQRERWQEKPLWSLAGFDGDNRIRQHQGVPEGRGDGGSRPSDRRQEASAVSGCGDGLMARMAAGHASSGDFDRVLVVDFGAQYAQLIARRVREAHVFSEIVPRDITAQEVKDRNPVGIILSGGPASVYADDAYGIDESILELGIPILGICYGHQVLAHSLGGKVARTGRGEYGRTDLETVATPSLLFQDLPDHAACVDEPR